ncbi:hypothetical protein ACWD7F_39855 [Streptomyces sp. NPDC005122]
MKKTSVRRTVAALVIAAAATLGVAGAANAAPHLVKGSGSVSKTEAGYWCPRSLCDVM